MEPTDPEVEMGIVFDSIGQAAQWKCGLTLQWLEEYLFINIISQWQYKLLLR